MPLNYALVDVGLDLLETRADHVHVFGLMPAQDLGAAKQRAQRATDLHLVDDVGDAQLSAEVSLHEVGVVAEQIEVYAGQ